MEKQEGERPSTHLHELLHLCHRELREVLQKSLLHLGSCHFLLLLSSPLQGLEHGSTHQQVDKVASHQQSCLQPATAHGLQGNSAGDGEREEVTVNPSHSWEASPGQEEPSQLWFPLGSRTGRDSELPDAFIGKLEAGGVGELQ